MTVGDSGANLYFFWMVTKTITIYELPVNYYELIYDWFSDSPRPQEYGRAQEYGSPLRQLLAGSV